MCDCMNAWCPSCMGTLKIKEKIIKRKKCIECDMYYADPPSKLCPGCQAYLEHTR